MYMYMYMSIILFIIANFLIILSNFISKKLKINYEKMTPFESGFNPNVIKRMPFSLRFFLITIIFLIFDVEIALLIPMLISMNVSNLFNWMMTSIFLLMILMIGLMFEWYNGALNWM